MTVVIGTAGHIDHGKTTLLRALTGIDADRLPEERRRGMTIDVGYAWLDLDDGTAIDFVDVPGHDGLIGNMLVGAGEIDAALLVVAADDGIRPQTVEHLELLDALGIEDGVVAITKCDLVPAGRAAEVADAVAALLRPTGLTGLPIVGVSATTGRHVDALREALVELRDRVLARASIGPGGPVRLAIDRAFAVKGRGAVVTGSLRGGSLRPGDVLRLAPRGIDVRVRGLHVHHGAVDVAGPGRAAINLAGVEPGELARGAVLTRGPGIDVSDRLLVQISPAPRQRSGAPGASRGREARSAWPPTDGGRVRLHLGTASVDAVVGRRGRDGVVLPDGAVLARLRLSEPVAVAVGDRGVIRRPSPGELIGGIRVLDPDPPLGPARRRADIERLAELARSVAESDVDAASAALVALHGAIPAARIAALAGALAGPTVERPPAPAGMLLAADVRDALEGELMAAVRMHEAQQPLGSGLSLATARRVIRTALRRAARVRREAEGAAEAATEAVIADLVTRRRLARDGDRLRDPARAAGPSPALAASMDRLEALLDVPAPPDLSAAARTAGCPPDGIRALEAAGRIVRIEADLAWSAPTFHRLAGQALGLARRAPLTPAALRDATGTSRRYVMPLIEDLNRRGILVRTAAGHVPGPRAPREAASGTGGRP